MMGFCEHGYEQSSSIKLNNLLTKRITTICTICHNWLTDVTELVQIPSAVAYDYYIRYFILED